MKTNIIYNEECLRGMSERIEDSSIDAIIADPPYGTTACSWDSVIPFDLMWEQINRYELIVRNSENQKGKFTIS